MKKKGQDAPNIRTVERERAGGVARPNNERGRITTRRGLLLMLQQGLPTSQSNSRNMNNYAGQILRPIQS
jgi:hypothetical protein